MKKYSENNDKRGRREFIENSALTRFARGEGIWFGENELYFACTNGGPNQYGQVFRYRLFPDEGNEKNGSAPGTIELFARAAHVR